ncbi:MAG: cytidine deaminase [Gammaproteobacteria bacterium]|nr:cytidine deaminase [Gammaproteobacteria bacterium]
MKMIHEAQKALKKSYSPYSNFPVGACIRSVDDQLFAACNIENASYSLAICAEAAAIACMIVAGQHRIKEVVVIGTGTELCSPCGACRQRLREFAAPDVLVHICDLNGVRKTMTMEDLLPVSFGPHNLEKKHDPISD